MNAPDSAVEGIAPDENWWRYAYWVMVPSGRSLFSHVSINVRLQYRRDTSVIWAVGVADASGTCRKAFGILSPRDKLATATKLLGSPFAVVRTAPIVDRYFWRHKGLVYMAKFLLEANASLTRMRDAGEQIDLQVVAEESAPCGYVSREASA